MEKEQLKLKGQATPEQMEAWKNLHGDVFEITAADKVAYLKRPDRKTMSAVSAIAETDPMRCNEIILENCWLGGDEEIKTNDRYFLMAISQLDVLANFGVATIKKL
jgi:hypothetical protein